MVAGTTRRRGLRGPLLATLGLWLALRQVDAVIKNLQAGGVGGNGADSLYALSPIDLPEYVRQLLTFWNSTGPVFDAAFFAYTGLDFLFILAYTVLFRRAFGRVGSPEHATSGLERALRRAPAIVLVLGLSDVVENALRLTIVRSDSATGWLVYPAWLATSIKWGALAAVLLLLLLASRSNVTGRPLWSEDSRWALGRLRIPAVLVAAFALILMLDPTGQVGDSFRRWLDSRTQFVTSAAWTLGGAALLGLATWSTARRSVLAGYRIAARPLSPARWAVAAGVLIAISFVFDLPNLWGPAAPLLLVAAVELVWTRIGKRIPGPERRKSKKEATTRRVQAARAPADGRERELRRWARGLGAFPLLAVLLGLAAAWTAPPVVLLPLEQDTTRAVWSGVAALAALALLPVAAWWLPRCLSGFEADGDEPGRPRVEVLGGTIGVLPERWEYRHLALAAATAALCVAAVVWPLDFPSEVGPVGMTAITLGLFVIALGEGQRYSDTHSPGPGLMFLGFSRVPVTLALLVALFVASLVDDGSYHSVRLNGEASPGQEGTPLRTAFTDWRHRNCATAGGRGRMIPMVFVASHGGGIRAAYWTSSVLTDLLRASGPDSACPPATAFGRVFTMGGASGGSLGVTSYVGHAEDDDRRWMRKAMGDTDFVAVPVSWALLVDLPRSLVGFRVADRQRRFEQVWEREDETLLEDFFASHEATAPILMLASTQVESGCRMNISPLRLTAPRSGSCTALRARPGSAGPLTTDVLDFMCAGSLARSTAALTSARFPYVSPSGQLAECGGERNTALVDGGYAENTGGQPILNLWMQVEPLIAEHNADPGRPRIVPVFVDIDNHYSKAARATPSGRTKQFLVPPSTFLRTDKLDDRGVEQLAKAAFSTALPGAPTEVCKLGEDGSRFVKIAPPESPGVQAPLGWTLSQMSITDLDRQRALALTTPPADALRELLAHGTCPA